MATNTFLDSATITALLDQRNGQTVDATAPADPTPGAIWWDSSAEPFVRRVFIAGGWEDSGARFDPTTGHLSQVQAGLGLSFSGSALNLDIAGLPLAP
ncbi:hypothetical protein N9W16_00315 [bacterium]|nr:hypothetical protein [bacterium]